MSNYSIKTFHYPDGEACLVEYGEDEEFWKYGVYVKIIPPFITWRTKYRKSGY
jgi:hypothetical protein